MQIDFKDPNMLIQAGLLVAIFLVLYTMISSTEEKKEDKEKKERYVQPACPYNCVHKNMGRWYIWNNCWQTCGDLTVEDIKEAMDKYEGEVFN